MQISPPASGRYLGVFTSDSGRDDADRFTAASGVSPAIVHLHLDWVAQTETGEPFFADFDTVHPDIGTTVVDLARDMARDNQILAISWDPLAIDPEDPDSALYGVEPELRLQDILNGSYDAYIRTVAQQVAGIDSPIMMNLLGEADAMSLFGYSASGTEFRESVGDRTGQYGDPALEDGPERVRDLFRHVIDIFEQEGARNASWFMYMSNGLMTEEDSIHPSHFYPGDSYIHWVGQSVYVDHPSELADSLAPGYVAWASVTDKPFFIPEMGLSAPGGPDDLRVLLDDLAGYDRVKAVTLTDFEAAEQTYGVTRIGSRSGDWDAVATADGVLHEVLVGETDDPVPLSLWRDATGRTASDMQIFGTAEADMIVGTDAQDVMIGGAGDDIYIVDHALDRVVEDANGGFDIVVASVSQTLDAHVEMLMLDGSADLDGIGNDLNNSLIGNDGKNRLSGGLGDDTLDGGAGADTLIGGSGNDLYLVDSRGDVVTETENGGEDLIFSSVTLTLPNWVEMLILDGTAAINGTGNAADNTIYGNEGSNRIAGGAGNDTLLGQNGNDTLKGDVGDDYLDGGAGDDTLSGQSGNDVLDGGAGNDRLVLESGADVATGGAGADTFVMRATGAMAIVTDFTAHLDIMDLQFFGLASMNDPRVSLLDAGGGSLLSLGGDTSVYFENISVAALLDSAILL